MTDKRTIGLDLLKSKHIHMIGIGGIGMSALADILCDSGIMVSGSDLKDNNLVGKLRLKGCRVNIGHKGVFGNPDFIVRSFSVKDANPEVIDARNRNIPVVERSELLRALISSKKNAVSVTGTHGKTTTTAMISYILDRSGLSPTVLIGGEQDYFNGNAKSGRSDILVSETDESDGRLVDISPRYVVLTNIEKEHMEHYKNMQNLLRAFEIFIRGIRPDGMLIYNKDDNNVRRLANYYGGKLTSFGLERDSDFYAKQIKQEGTSLRFACYRRSRNMGEIVINMPGVHNVYNTLAAVAVSMELGASFDQISDILRDFRNVKRRFEIKSRDRGIILIEDYAHHPTEIRNVIKMAKSLNKMRIIVVFQPHRYSRTMIMQREIADAFTESDHLILTDIYSANEEPLDGININTIYRHMKKKDKSKVKLMKKNDVPAYLSGFAKKDDVILILGAGDINEIVPDIARQIEAAGCTKNRDKL